MGLTKRIEGKIHEIQEHHKEEKQWKQTVKEKNRAEYRKGYEEGATKSAYAKGQQAAGYYPKGKGGKTQGVTGRGVLGGVAGFGEGVGKGLKNADGIFGFSGGFGLGGEPSSKPAQARPSRVTTVDPRTGKVRTEHYDAPKQEHHENWDPWAMGGGPAKKKKEKDEYESFWG